MSTLVQPVPEDYWYWSDGDEGFSVVTEGGRDAAIEEAVEALSDDLDGLVEITVGRARRVSAANLVPSFEQFEETMQDRLVDEYHGDHDGYEVQPIDAATREAAKATYEAFIRVWATTHYNVDWYEAADKGEDVTLEVKRRVAEHFAAEGRGA